MFRYPGDAFTPLLHRYLLQRSAIHEHRPAFSLDEAQQEVRHSTFPRSARPNQRHLLTGLYVKRDVVQRGALAIVDVANPLKMYSATCYEL